MEAVLTLDIGTSSCKGALYSAEGRSLAVASASYPIHRPAPGVVEQDPADYLAAGRAVCRELLAASAVHAVRAVGISTQTPTLVFCDAEGQALAPAIIWQDSRAGAEAAEILGIDPSQRRGWFGMDLPIGAAATPSKVLWVRRHRPDLWERTRWIVQPKDYVAVQLTGEMATDLWCAKGLASIATGRFDGGYLEFLETAADRSPVAGQPDTVAGYVTARAADEWGLPAGIPVITGWSDALAGMLATGALHTPQTGFVLSGTSEIIGLSRPPGGAEVKGLFTVPSPVLPLENVEIEYGPVSGGGSTLAWLTRVTGKSTPEVLALVEGRADRLSPILFRPYLDGERAPYWDHTLAAGFEGIRSEHGLSDLVHAVLQGVALQERLVLERSEQGARASTVVLAGGAARDREWNRIRANVLQRRLLILADPEASLRGVALLAWAGTGVMRLADPPAVWFEAEELLPDPELAFETELLTNRFLLVK